MSAYLKSDQLPNIKKEKKLFGQRKNKGGFGNKPSKPLKKSIMKKKRITTNGEKDFLEWLQFQDSYTCFHCGCHGVEWHHVKLNSSDKKDHARLLPLCPNHHRLSMVFSVHGTAKAWRDRYKMAEQLDYARLIYERYLKEKECV